MKRTLLHILILTVITFAFYARSIDNYWIKDDLAIGNFTDGEEVSWDLLKREFWPDYMESEHYWRPIPLLPGYFESKVWGLNPVGFHLDNILMHIGVAVLLYFLVNRLTRKENPVIGLAAALLFAINPINSEAVVWIMQRMVIICMGMSAAALLCWLNAVEKRSIVWRVAGLLFFALALLSKEIALTLPGLFFLIDLFYQPGEDSGPLQWRQAFKGTIFPAILIAAYFGCRHIMWGQVVNTYAGLDPWEYAKVNRVFENMGNSLLSGFAPVNAGMFEEPAVLALRGVMLSAFSVALLRSLVLLKTNPFFRRLAAISLTTILLGLLPIIPIFWIDERLFNARFFYQPAFGFMMLVAATLLMPFKIGQLPSHFDAIVGRITLSFYAVALAIALGGGLVAFDRGGDQVRFLQQQILEYSDQLEEAGDKGKTVVSLYTPTQYEGVPTLEYSLKLALRPPLAPRRVSCIPLLSRDFLTPGKWSAELKAAVDRRNIPLEDLRWVWCSSKPTIGVQPYFGAREPRLGEHAPRPIEPRHNSWRSNDGLEPSFRFKASAEAKWFRIRMQVPSVDYPWGPKLVPGLNCVEEKPGEFVFKPSFKDPSQPSLPDLWQKMMRRPLKHPLPLVWRVAAYDANDKLIGVSQTFNLVVLNAIPWPEGQENE